VPNVIFDYDRAGDLFAVDPKTGRAHCHSAWGRGRDIFAPEQVLAGSNFTAARDEVFRLLGRPAMGPSFRKLGGAVRYGEGDVLAWITSTPRGCGPGVGVARSQP
jgi:hypothetical protein